MPNSRRREQPAVLASRDYLQGCLLLLIAESPAHGYELVERLPDLGVANVDSAAVYRALRALDDDGLLESWWEGSESGPARRRYRVSEAGAGTLEGWAAMVHDSASRLSAFVTRHRRVRRARMLLASPA